MTKVVDYGAFVRIDDGLNGLVHISELSDKLVKDPSKFVKNGDTYELEIISISKDERHLGLSLKGAQKPVGEVEVGIKKSTNSVGSSELSRLSEYLDEE